MDSLGLELIESAVKVTILANMEIPRSWTKKKKQQAVSNEITPGRPDIDNISKAALDALNGVVFKDDDQVVELRVIKRYSTSPALVIMVELI